MFLTRTYWGIKELGRSSFSEGLALIQVGKSLGYIDKTGKIVINPQFSEAFPFYGGLALVVFGSGSDSEKEMAYIDKEGKTVWRETKQTSNAYSNSSTSNSNMAVVVNSNSMSGGMMSSSNTAVVVNNTNITNSNMTMNPPPQSSNSSTSSERTGQLTTDSNIRSEPNKDAASLGVNFRGAKVKILDETSYTTNDGEATWYKIRVTEYGCSKDANLGCGKNAPNDSDEGWVNAKNLTGVAGMRSQQPQTIESNYSVNTYNVDDLAMVYVNGSKILETSFYRNGNTDITRFLRPGNNEVRFVLQNSKDGFTYGFEIRRDNKSIFKDDCGVAGKTGCRGSSQTGIVYDRTIAVQGNSR